MTIDYYDEVVRIRFYKKQVTWFPMLGSLNISYLLPIVGTKRPRGIVFIDCILGPTNSKEYYAPRVVECMIMLV